MKKTHPVAHNLNKVAYDTCEVEGRTFDLIYFPFWGDSVNESTFRARLDIQRGCDNKQLSEKLRNLADQIESGSGVNTRRGFELFEDAPKIWRSTLSAFIACNHNHHGKRI